MKKDLKGIVNDLLAQAEELELHAKWLKTIAEMLESRPANISEESHSAVLGQAIESVAKQIALNAESVEAISGGL